MEKQNQRHLLVKSRDNAGEQLYVATPPIDKKLQAFVHCSIAYIDAMLQKLEQRTEEIVLEIEEEKTGGKLTGIHLCFHIRGQIIKDVAWKACHHSIQRYCPLAEAMQKRGTKISWEIKLGLPGQEYRNHSI